MLQKSDLIEYIGTEYGGFPVCVQYIEDGDIIYDIGVGEDISFTEGVLERKECEVHLFDFTPQSIEWFKENYSDKENMIFHEHGLSDHDGELEVNHPDGSRRPAWLGFEHNETWPVKKLKTIMEELGHEKIDVLKMDIEGEEYRVLPDMLASKIFPTQVCVEFHDRWLTEENYKLHVDVITLMKEYYELLLVVHNKEAIWMHKGVFGDD